MSATDVDVFQRLSWARVPISALFLILGAGFGSWAVRIPDVQERAGLSEGELGIALLAVAVGSMIGMPLAGVLATRMDGAVLTRRCAMAFAASLALPALSSGLVQLCAVLLAFGASNGALGVAMNGQAVLLERRLGCPIMSSFHGVFSIGALVGSLSSGVLAGAGIPVACHLAAVSAVLLGITFLAGPRLLQARAESGTPAFVRPSRGLLAFGALAFCVLFCEGAVTDWSAVYLRNYLGVSAGISGAGYSAFAVAMALGRLAGDRLVVTWGQRQLVTLAGACATIGAVLILAAPLATLAVAGFALLGASLSVVFPNALSAAGRSQSTQPDAAIAAVSTVGYLGFLLGPPVIGFIAEATSLRDGLLILLVCTAGIPILAKSLYQERRT